ncbi:YibL family ribosome-associated protein [Candidatus Sodalis endolongispinus]|uniref:YibL family ribosome-associated protein n=1 Tax=Candidatus Sodalis endolongispinus TaxID=2812662 RepID=A0ABS5Y8B3_9GAMM|nr:YibL family ribosome-associated protein [Candidatus Sodalis endolongispinus]MBT9431244.1 YibL family ribosome-associated protein [Candidatus Sodalis endolongispinus]
MKEQEKTEIKRLSDLLDALNHKEASVIAQGDPGIMAQHREEKTTLETEIHRLKNLRVAKLSKQAQQLQALSFSRTISKKEQADMGALKKKVRGLVVVHPMTSLGREMGLKEVTGYASGPF